MKICNRCELEKELEDFYTYKTKGAVAYFNHCKDCAKTYQRRWTKSNPENVKRHVSKSNKRKHETSKANKPAILNTLKAKYGERSTNDLAIAHACEKWSWTEVFEARVEKHDECLVWTLGTRPNGYGQFMVTYGKYPEVVHLSSVLPHRLSYALANGFEALPVGKSGPNSDTLVIDHICRNPLCVNPDHLQVVTQERNMQLRQERAA